MKIGIIGSGTIGGTLARRLTKLGHEVSIANSRGPASLKDFARETGARAVSVEDAARSGEIVIVAIPERRVLDLPRGLFDGVPDDVVVVDTGNYYPRERDGRIEPIENGMTESRWASSVFGRPVVKAFNNIYAQQIASRATAPGTPGRRALPVAGDDPAAKRKVMALIDELGFDAIDAGTLDDSWRQQPGTPVYGLDYDEAATRRALSEAKRERPAEVRGSESSPGAWGAPA
jgi:predicted dinucleotide-binding enzyme